MSPDPAGAGSNLYAYPTNPNSLVDPTGHIAKLPFNNPSIGSLGGNCYFRGYAMSCADVETLELNGTVALTAVPSDTNNSLSSATSSNPSQVGNFDPVSAANNLPVASSDWLAAGNSLAPGAVFFFLAVDTIERPFADPGFDLLLYAWGTAMPSACASGVSCGVVFPTPEVGGIGNVGGDVFEGAPAGQGFTVFTTRLRVALAYLLVLRYTNKFTY
jgi:hypothetical protein